VGMGGVGVGHPRMEEREGVRTEEGM